MKNKRLNFLFIMTTLLIFPLPQLAIDLYLPSLPAMAESLHASNFLLQLSLTVYILTLGISQLFYGPCSDRFGRRPILLIGTIIFLIGSIACIFATSIMQVLIFRAIQGFGMGCGFTVASSIIGDSFQGPQLARMTTFSSMIYSLSPILAPVLGGYLQYYIGWRANFSFIAIFSILVLLAILFFIPETNKNLDLSALKIKKLTLNYARIICNRRFIANVATLTLTFGIMITFNVVGPFLLQNVLNVSSVTYGQLLLLVGVSYLVGTTLNSQLLKSICIDYLILAGLVLMLLFGFSLLFSGWVGWFSTTSVMLFTCLEIFSTGLVFPNCFAKALEVFPENLGSATALIGSAGLIGTSMISVVVAHIHTYQEQPLAYMFLAQAMLALIFFLIALKPIPVKTYPEN